MYVQCDTKGYKMSINMTSTDPLVHGLLRKDPIENTHHIRNYKMAELLYFTVRAQISIFSTSRSIMWGEEYVKMRNEWPRSRIFTYKCPHNVFTSGKK